MSSFKVNANVLFRNILQKNVTGCFEVNLRSFSQLASLHSLFIHAASYTTSEMQRRKQLNLPVDMIKCQLIYVATNERKYLFLILLQ